MLREPRAGLGQYHEDCRGTGVSRTVPRQALVHPGDAHAGRLRRRRALEPTDPRLGRDGGMRVGGSVEQRVQHRIVWPVMSAALCLLLAATLVARAHSPARDEKLATSLREAVHSVPVAAAGANIVVTSFRPRGNGPFPWLVLSHGAATTLEANRAMGRYRPLHPVHEWVRRGYAVLVPVRRGYGASGGEQLGDAYGSCSRPDFRRAGEGAALDLLATVEWA